MWKVIVGFIVFAALAMYVLTKSGGDIDLGGEKHGVETPPAADAAGSAAMAPAASAASSSKP